MKIVFSDAADADLLQLITYIATRNPTAARDLATEFDAHLLNLSRFPLIGREREILAPGLRSILVRRYVVFYRIESDRVLIMRVLDGRRDIDAEFETS
jgi:toxin ParE1/3/4